MNYKYIVSVLLVSLITPLFLYGLPQDEEVFLDFEDAEGSGDFTLGDPPNEMRFIGFTVETLEDPSLLHSGTKAINPGTRTGREDFQSEKGIAEIEFYAAESYGRGQDTKSEVNVNIRDEGTLAK